MMSTEKYAQLKSWGILFYLMDKAEDVSHKDSLLDSSEGLIQTVGRNQIYKEFCNKTQIVETTSKDYS